VLLDTWERDSPDLSIAILEEVEDAVAMLRMAMLDTILVGEMVPGSGPVAETLF